MFSKREIESYTYGKYFSSKTMKKVSEEDLALQLRQTMLHAS